MIYKLLSSFRAMVCLTCILLSDYSILQAGNPVPTLQYANQVSQSKNLVFQENKGQLADPGGKVLTDIKYYGRQAGVAVYCKSTMLSFVFSKANNPKRNIDVKPGKMPSHTTPKADTVQTARMEMELLGANANAQIVAEDKQESTTNYFLAHTVEHGISGVNSFKKLTYKDIYPHIDMILQAKGQGMEYSFLVHAGGDVNDIKLRWNGTDAVESLEGGGMRFKNTLGSMEQSSPMSYVEEQLIQSSLVINEEAVYGFQVANYDKSKDLLIDPQLIWGTYYGGRGAEVAFSIKNDKAGNVFIAGMTNSAQGIATNGAYKQAKSGTDVDVFLAKFNRDGKLLWGTYYGGDTLDIESDMALDASGNIFITGLTCSKNGIATSGAYQTSNNGGIFGNIFVAKFSNAGALLWATYYGALGANAGNGICCDPSNNVYITGYTPDTAGTTVKALFLKFNSIGKLDIATYFGNDTFTNAQKICSDPNGNIFIEGYAVNGFDRDTNTLHKIGYRGFVAKLSDKGKLYKLVYYGDSDTYAAAGICSDNLGNIYVAGWTTSANKIATSGTHQTSYGGKLDAFLIKYDNSVQLKWGTYYGGSDLDEAEGLCTDDDGNIYMSGLTSSSDNIATPDAYQSNNAFNLDGFLARFNSDGILVWASYYGSSLTAIYAISVYKNRSIYITGQTYADTGIATLGAHQTTYEGNTYDSAEVFLAKFYYKPGVDAGIDSINSPNATICKGNVPVKVDLHNYGHQDLVSANINWSISGVAQPAYKWTGTLKPDSSALIILNNGTSFDSGTYKIIAYTSQPNGTIDSATDNDTTILSLIVNPLPKAAVGPTQSICYGSSVGLGIAPVKGHNYHWVSSPGADTSDSANPVFKPQINTTYKLTETIITTGCAKTDSVKVKVGPRIIVNAGGNHSYCKEASKITIGEVATKGFTYSWASNPPGFKDSLSNPTIRVDSNTTYYLTVTDTASKCRNKDSATITIYGLPNADAGPDALLCYDQVYTMKAKGGGTYTWLPATYLSSPNDSNAKAKLPNTQRYVLVVANAHGCTDTSSVLLRVRPRLKVRAFASQEQVCYGQSVALYARGMGGDSQNYHFSWTNDSIKGQSVMIKILKTGWYKIALNDYCTPEPAMDSIYINILPAAKAAFNYLPGQNVKVNRAVNFINQSQYASVFLWNFGNKDNSRLSSPEYSYTDSGLYKITLIAYSQYGCANDTAIKYIHIYKNILKVYIPNVFTPNGDGVNDVFGISGIGFQSNTFHIYDRWGGHIFQNSPARPVWDGTYQGQDAPEGVYLYTVDVYDLDGEHHFLNGTVTLLRP